MFENIIELIQEIAEDRTVPRNIREKCNEAIEILKDESQEKDVRINAVTGLLDEISNDTNIPMYTRTQIWNIASLLEAAKKE
ncbi:MAG: UPF0147 family protein [Candidatus Aenigmarchaeota archaeon]|nr:UPF0147 family protein [Candidatus Aenigmarchaeota archaeon]